ncbi:MAG: hypothetical protein AAFQ43_00500 [Bacteroidota bacterium]
MSTAIQPHPSVKPNTLQISLRKDGEPIDYDEALQRAPSLAAALMATGRAVVGIDDAMAAIDVDVAELQERLAYHETLGLPTKGLKATITRRGNAKKGLQRRRKVHEAFYIEVPDMGGERLKMGDHKDRRWAENLSTEVPLDVLHALAHAKEQGLFDEFRIYTPSGDGVDPMIVGVLRRNPEAIHSEADACFYIASWR